jgi:PBSX family phage portal protein
MSKDGIDATEQEAAHVAINGQEFYTIDENQGIYARVVDLDKTDVSKGDDIDVRTLVSTKDAPHGVIEPPYNPKALYRRYENSAILRPNIDAYVTNIDSFGHHFIPAIDLVSQDAKARIADIMLYESLIDETGTPVSEMAAEPTEKEVQARLDQLIRLARIEYMRLRAFFSYACPNSSLTDLRRRTRQDLEVTGNAYWEVLRNESGQVARLHYVNPINMRIAEPPTKIGYEPVEVETMVKHTDITWVKMLEPMVFRTFVKLHGGRKGRRTYYKEFGDPRIISNRTGKTYKTERALKQKEPKAGLATEVLHFRIFSPTSEYGIPRWITNLPSVLGSIELDHVNYEYFDNNVIPPLALLVSGGRLGAEAAARIESIVEDRIKGRKGINRMLIIEARGFKNAGDPGPTPSPKLEFVPLRAVQQTDALFQTYDERNEDKVAMSFRLPRILRGNDTKLNRATAFASVRLAEDQIFEPEREHFDSIINARLLAALGITFWQFRSNAPIIRDPERMAVMVEQLVSVGVLMPSEGREMLQDMFNRTFLEISEDWTNKPLPLTLAQLKAGKLREERESGTANTDDQDADDRPIDSRAAVASTLADQAGAPSLPATASLKPLGGSNE